MEQRSRQPRKLEQQNKDQDTKEKDMQKEHILFCVSEYRKKNRRSEMQYLVEENCLTIFLPQEVDHHNAQEIKKEADKLIEKKHIKYVIFDFQKTDFMDSSGIGVIMGRYRQIYLLGGEVWAVHASPRMKKILTMSGVTTIIQLYEEEKE